MELTFTTLEQQNLLNINICGTPCVGDCQTCVQSNADLNAFYGVATEPLVIAAPVEVQEMAYAGDEEPEEDQTLEEARAMDAMEEAQRSGEAYDDDEGGYRGCHCLDCLNHDDENYVPSYYERDYDDGYGLDWNESGYFD